MMLPSNLYNLIFFLQKFGNLFFVIRFKIFKPLQKALCKLFHSRSCWVTANILYPLDLSFLDFIKSFEHNVKDRKSTCLVQKFKVQKNQTKELAGVFLARRIYSHLTNVLRYYSEYAKKTSSEAMLTKLFCKMFYVFVTFNNIFFNILI